MGDALRALLDSATTYPTVILTVLVGLVVAYWVLSILTGLSGEVDGALEGALEGMVDSAAEGALEGVVDGLAEGAGEAAAEGIAGTAAEGATESLAWRGLGRVFGCLGLTAVPVTLFLSMLILFTWIASLGLSRILGHRVDVATTGLVAGGSLLVVSTLAGLLLTSLAVRPLKPLFQSPDTLRRRDLVGQTVTIRSMTVDSSFGQAEYADGQAGLLLDVRCEDSGQAGRDPLTRGCDARITHYDPVAEVFWVEPSTPGGPPTGSGERSEPQGGDRA